MIRGSMSIPFSSLIILSSSLYPFISFILLFLPLLSLSSFIPHYIPLSPFIPPLIVPSSRLHPPVAHIHHLHAVVLSGGESAGKFADADRVGKVDNIGADIDKSYPLSLGDTGFAHGNIATVG